MTENKIDESEEAFAYTPGLKIKESMTVQKERKLPLLGEVSVKVGDEVEDGSPVASTLIAGDPYIVDITQRLGTLASTINELLTIKIGDSIEKGEVLARYDMLFGLFKRTVPAPESGTLESTSEITGRAILRGTPIPVAVDAYIPGKVIEVMPKEGAVIETHGALIQGIFGIGGETHGVIKIAVDSQEDELTEDKVGDDESGNILIGGSLLTIGAIKKAIKAGAIGLVGGGINSKDLTEFLGEEIGVAITGEEDVGSTVIITEGFGKLHMHTKTFEILKKFEGYRASINGETQIRAGVIRPEIIIPHSEVEEDAKEGLEGGMVSGTPIRIIRNPHFGSIGKVVNLPVELQKLESESFVRVMVVELEDGSQVTVPRANVEIIEE